MPKILITQDALRSMWQASQCCPTETGGILAGLTQSPLILFAGEPGPKAIKSYASFRSDPQQDKQCLLEARQLYAECLEIIGYWHKHPQGMRQPSQGDVWQARQLQQAWKKLGEAAPWFISIILQEAPTPEKAAFVYWLASEDEHFEASPTEIIEANDPQIQQLIALQPTRHAATQQGHPWLDPTFRFQHTPAGRLRLETELLSLQQNGYHVTTQQRRSDQRLSFVLRKQQSEILCVFPVEYPLGAPRFFWLPGGEEAHPLRQAPCWNSDFTVVDCLEKLFSEQQSSYEHPQHLHSTIDDVNSMQTTTADPGQKTTIRKSHRSHASPATREWLISGTLVCSVLGMTVGMLRRKHHRLSRGER